jgi:hypothetical protein
MEADMKKALEWWIEEHTSAPFTYKKMQITRQHDSYSCGLLTWNALSHHLLPNQHPLIDATDVAFTRIRVLSRICE